MKKLFCALCLALLCTAQQTRAAASRVEPGCVVAVMDFGTHPGAATAEIAIESAGETTSEYVVARLLTDGRLDIADKDMMCRELEAAGLKTVGIIDPASAKAIGKALGVRYLVYGNLHDVSASDTGTSVIGVGGTEIHTVKAHVIARIMDVETGTILTAAKGEGKSKSSYTEIDAGVAGIRLGAATVTQESVHNAIQKAAYAAADLLCARLYGDPVDGKGKKGKN